MSKTSDEGRKRTNGRGELLVDQRTSSLKRRDAAWLRGATNTALAALTLCAMQSSAATPPRGDILDRRGVVLATSQEAPSLYANPHKIHDPAAVATAIAKRVEHLDADALRQALSRDSPFVWIARRVDEEEARAVKALKLDGIGEKLERARRYPQGKIAAHVVGYTTGDVASGLAGIEMSRDAELSRGQSERLSIDMRVQRAVRNELSSAMHDYSASAAAGIVLDANSGEILALVSLPDFDPADRISIASGGYRNMITSNVYELGGVFEIFTAAAALEAHRVEPDTRFKLTPTLRIGAHVVRDEEPVRGPLSVRDIFARSSLIGAALIAQRSAPEEQQAQLRRMGLLDPMRVELAESGGQPLVNAHAWGPYLRASIGFGYGIAVTPLQAASVATAIVHHGVLVEPTLLERSSAPAGHPIVSEETSSEMRELLRGAVLMGTGHAADVPGYEVGGKTGTSLKQVGSEYDRMQRRTWFFAGFPMSQAPRYTLLVVLDEPHGRSDAAAQTTAEWNAVPTAARIIAQIGPLLGMTHLSKTQSL